MGGDRAQRAYVDAITEVGNPQPYEQIAASIRSCGGAYHVLPPFHEFFVDDFASVILSSFDMNRLLDDCIRAATEGTSCAVLEPTKPGRRNHCQRHQVRITRVRRDPSTDGTAGCNGQFYKLTWQGTVAGCRGMAISTSDSWS